MTILKPRSNEIFLSNWSFPISLSISGRTTIAAFLRYALLIASLLIAHATIFACLQMVLTIECVVSSFVLHSFFACPRILMPFIRLFVFACPWILMAFIRFRVSKRQRQGCDLLTQNRCRCDCICDCNCDRNCIRSCDWPFMTFTITIAIAVAITIALQLHS